MQNGEFLGFLPKDYMGIICYLSTVSERFVKVNFTYEFPLAAYTKKNISLYYSELKQSSALIFAPGIYLSEYYLRCKYACNRSLHFGAVGVHRNFP